MNHPVYTYDANEFREAWDKQARERRIVNRDAALIQCFSSIKHAKSYAESKNLSVDLVLAVWSSRARA